MKKRQRLLLACCALALASCMREPTSEQSILLPNFSFSTFTLPGAPFGSVVTVPGTAWIAQSTNGTVRQMNVATGAFSNTVTLGAPGSPQPVTLATNGTGTRLYVAAYDHSANDQGRVVRINLTTTPPSVLSTYLLSGDANGILALPTGDIVYVGMTNGKIYKLNLATGTQLASNTSLAVASGYHFALNPAGTFIYATSRDYGIYKLDANTLQPGLIRNITGQPQGIVFSLDGTKIYVAMQAGDIRVFDATTLDHVATINTGGCSGFSLVYAKGLLYDSCVLNGKVVIVDPLANQIKATEIVNGRPRELSYDPSTGKIVAPNEDGWVNRIDPPAIPEPRFVAPPPTGSAGNPGTIALPWDLGTALTSAPAGTTVWLRGGTYGPNTDVSTNLVAPSAPTVFRQYPGERATIDGRLQIRGSNLQFWGLEFMMSNPAAYAYPNPTKKGIEVLSSAQGIKLINLVVHDAGASGLIYYWPAGSVETLGSIFYNNGAGAGSNGHSHGVYIQNKAGFGTARIAGSVLFNNQSYGVHAFSDNTPGSAYPLANINVENNILFNNGTISVNGPKSSIIMGSEIAGSANLNATGNVSYWSPPQAPAVENGIGIYMGYTNSSGFTAQGTSMSVQSNILLGGRIGLTLKRWTGATVSNNIIGGPVTNAQPTKPIVLEDPGLTSYTPRWTWANNTYYHQGALAHWVATYQANPAGVSLATFLSATQFGTVDQATGTTYPAASGLLVNTMDPNRAFVWIYNPGGGTYGVANMGSFLQSCYAYKVYNVQNVFGNPVYSAPCAITNLVLPMTGTGPPPPIGRTETIPIAPTTGPWFHVFLVVKY